MIPHGQFHCGNRGYTQNTDFPWVKSHFSVGKRSIGTATIVLKLLENWHPLETLGMKHLAFKTVALVGLVSAQRSQALAALTLKDSVGGWNEILCIKTVKNISTRKELNSNHSTRRTRPMVGRVLTLLSSRISVEQSQ